MTPETRDIIFELAFGVPFFLIAGTGAGLLLLGVFGFFDRE